MTRVANVSVVTLRGKGFVDFARVGNPMTIPELMALDTQMNSQEGRHVFDSKRWFQAGREGCVWFREMDRQEGRAVWFREMASVWLVAGVGFGLVGG